MNPPTSLYKRDFVPYDWLQNNITPNSENFCSPDNVEDCIQYISEELGALGYPSIYQRNSDPSSASCDIVALLNVTFELIGCTKDHAQVKDDLECRIQRLSSDLNLQSKKNTQMKENIDALERKYRSVLERERQLKEKNEKQSQLLKNEKEEFKKLSSQMQKQKVTYEHEVRKQEKSINQLKARLKQILSDKNTEKKVATVSSSSLLQRNSKERGKWVSGTAVKSSIEEMYNSLIASYENRNQEVLKELTDYQQCFVYLQDEMQNLVTSIKGEKENVVPLHTIGNGPNKTKDLKARFNCLLGLIKDSATEKNFEKDQSSQISCEQSFQSFDSLNNGLESFKDTLENKKRTLEEKEKELSRLSVLIEKEKASLENQRLEVIKMAVQQDSVKSDFSGTKPSPSLAVVTTNDNLTFLPNAPELRQCLSDTPKAMLPTPLWNMTHSEVGGESSSKGSTPSNLAEYDLVPPIPIESPNISFPTSDLPKWAASCLDSDSQELNCQLDLNESVSNEDLDASALSEEQNLARLKAAFEDLELRRKNLPTQ